MRDYIVIGQYNILGGGNLRDVETVGGMVVLRGSYLKTRNVLGDFYECFNLMF